MSKRKRNDDDRAQWIDNDEGLYSWWKSSRQSRRVFIRENRDEIDKAIDGALDRPPKTTLSELQKYRADVSEEIRRETKRNQERN